LRSREAVKVHFKVQRSSKDVVEVVEKQRRCTLRSREAEKVHFKVQRSKEGTL
jgi:hypothetical protein